MLGSSPATPFESMAPRRAGRGVGGGAAIWLAPRARGAPFRSIEPPPGRRSVDTDLLAPRARGTDLLDRQLHATARDDVVLAVRPAHPRLLTAVIVFGEQNQRRRLAQRRAGVRALRVEA